MNLDNIELKHLKGNIFFAIVPRKVLSAASTNLYDLLPVGTKKMNIYTPDSPAMFNGYSVLLREATKEVNFETHAVVVVKMQEWGLTKVQISKN
jgi:hypothetical protein